MTSRRVPQDQPGGAGIRRVLAAIDSSPTACGVLAVAPWIATLLDADIDAVHVLETRGGTARAAAEQAKVPLRARQGLVEEVLIEEAASPEVVAVVIGTRSAHLGPRPAGHVALHLSGAIDKPLVMVPPETTVGYRLKRLLVPLDGAAETSLALRELLSSAHARKLDVDVLHVWDEADMPAFEDHPPHAKQAWAREFLARYCPTAPAAQAELRPGIPAEEILGMIAERKTDLVALGWSRTLSTDRAEVVRATLERVVVPVVLLPIPAGTEATEHRGIGLIKRVRRSPAEPSSRIQDEEALAGAPAVPPDWRAARVPARRRR
jgi:hypothetical protein